MNNTIHLPEAFKERIKTILPQEEVSDFLATYNKERTYGIRVNPLKCTEEKLVSYFAPYALEKVTWAKEGYYYQSAMQPGKRVLHEAGAYYIQEPSAMAVVSLLAPEPGEIVLDLCAAPGGKTTQIAGCLKGEGLLVSNEIHPGRCKILSQNVERMGVTNCVVTNENAEGLSKRFPHFFDKILVDAPCSGEGMFRKEPEAIVQWSEQNVLLCAQRQQEILNNAAMMLKPGGVLVYSTCTFSREENEDSIETFLAAHPEFVLEKMHRIWPHRERGEGHFMARLCKQGENAKVKVNLNNEESSEMEIKGPKKLVAEIQALLQGELGMETGRLSGQLLEFGDQVYLVPVTDLSLQGMKVERPGLHLATKKKNRLEPAHGLAMAIGSFPCKKKVTLAAKQAVSYLKGEALTLEEENLLPGEREVKGWCVVQYEGCSLGLAKATGNLLKNHYPKGLRKEVVESVAQDNLGESVSDCGENAELFRINKYLATCGVCSRRQADALLEQGKVLVNGKVAMMGQLVSSLDQVAVDGEEVHLPKEHVVLAYYKPVGVVCTERDKHAKRTVVDELGYDGRVTYAGRLDQDSEGLLLMTDDGDLIDAMMRGKNGHEKEYIVQVNREIKDEDIDFWERGVYLKALGQKTRPCKIEKLGKYEMKIILTQGLNRQIRRMCQEKNYQVVRLKRIRIMNVFLATLKPGEYRKLDANELEVLYRSCGLR